MEITKYNTLQPFEEIRQKLFKPSYFNFSSDFMFYWLIFGSSHLQLCKKNSCSVKLQGWPFDHNSRKIPVENGWIIISQNNFKCLLLSDKQMLHEIMFILLQKQSYTFFYRTPPVAASFVRRNTKHKKDETRESKERKFEKKVRKIVWVVLIFSCLCFSVGHGRSK